MLTKTLTTARAVGRTENETPVQAADFRMGGAWLEHATSCL
jgi:hypothetical protein